MRTVQRAAHENQVAFFETDIAPSGGKVMLMGGAPRSTGKDEERMLRAMRAVLDVNSPLPLRIGVNRGRIFVGDFGPPYRRTYSVKGDAVNLAARLMAKAEPGQLLTTDDVLERSRTRFDTVALEPFQAKGKAEPVQAYVVGSSLGLKERSASAPLVGREHELSVLVEALDSARHYEGKIVELVAEPGMGKSRLIEELRATAEGVAVRSVQCEEYESATPSSPSATCSVSSSVARTRMIQRPSSGAYESESRSAHPSSRRGCRSSECHSASSFPTPGDGAAG